MGITFTGLRGMDAPMAHNLLKVDRVLSVSDLNTQTVDTLVGADAVAVVPPGDAATGAETVITVLPAAAHVHHVSTAKDDVLADIAKNVPTINPGIISPVSAKALGVMAAGRSNPSAGAPVSNGMDDAVTGILIFIVSGNAAAFEQVCPVLSTMGKNPVRCGNTDAGQDAKICNNPVLGATMADVAEAMSLGEMLGIDPKVLGGIINTSTGRRWGSDTYSPLPGMIDTALSSHSYTNDFGTNLVLEDLGLAGGATESVRQPVYLDALAQQLYQAASGEGDGKLDFSAVIKLYRKDGAA